MRRLHSGRWWRALVLAAGFWCLGAGAGEVLVLGDSISAGYGIAQRAGWVALLAEGLAKRCPGAAVHNASVSGETSIGGLRRLPELLARRNPRVVVIELGGNDGLRGLPPDRMGDNLNEMIRLARAAGAKPVLLGMKIPPNYGPVYQRRFERVFAEVAEQQQLPFAAFLLEDLDGEHFQADGIHPTAAAQPILLRNAWPPLARALGDAGLCDADPRWALQGGEGAGVGG